MATPPQPSDIAAPRLSSKQQRELVKWRKELEEREEDITRRERLIDEGVAESQQELRILEGRITAAKETLSNSDSDLKARQRTAEIVLKETERAGKVAADETVVMQQLADTRRQELAELAGQVKVARKKLRDLDKDRQERVKYQAEQEVLIENIIKDGNHALADINRQVGEFERQREELLRNTHTLEENLRESRDDLVSIEERIDMLQERYEVTVVKYRSDLASIRDELDTATKSKADTEKLIEARQVELKAREQELSIRSDVLNKQAEEIQGEKRKLESKKALYGIL